MSKNKLPLILLAAGVLGGTAYGFYTLGRHQAAPQSSAMPAATGGPAAGDKKVLYWHDPMVPGQKFDKPGKSPFMDMQLVPVYAGDAGDEGRVSISPRVRQNLGIRTAEVSKGSLAAVLTAVGSVAYDEREVVLVQARSNGFVEKLHVRAPLDPVRKGQALAELYIPDWIAAQEEYLAVKRMPDKGMDGLRDGLRYGLLDGARQRMRLAGMSDEQIRLVESSGSVHARITIAAPASGVLAELTAREGMSVTAGAPLFRINGMDTVWLNAEIPENAAAQVRPGMAVEARTASLPGTVFKGKLNALLPQVDTSTRTMVARIELGNPARQLVPGMFANVSFSPVAGKEVLLAPSEAVIQTGTRSVVMLARGEGEFQPVDVEIGSEANGLTEIRKGLEAGQKVVISGQFLIDSEASLKGTATRMGDSGASDDSKAAGKTHHGTGRVEKIGKDEITISHGPIPSLQWGPMTMDFKLPANGLPRNVEVGDTVIFDIQAVKDGVFQITSITPTVTPASAGAKP